MAPLHHRGANCMHKNKIADVPETDGETGKYIIIQNLLSSNFKLRFLFWNGAMQFLLRQARIKEKTLPL